MSSTMPIRRTCDSYDPPADLEDAAPAPCARRAPAPASSTARPASAASSGTAGRRAGRSTLVPSRSTVVSAPPSALMAFLRVVDDAAAATPGLRSVNRPASARSTAPTRSLRSAQHDVGVDAREQVRAAEAEGAADREEADDADRNDPDREADAGLEAVVEQPLEERRARADRRPTTRRRRRPRATSIARCGAQVGGEPAGDAAHAVGTKRRRGRPRRRVPRRDRRGAAGSSSQHGACGVH